jgi:hypothetical protein
VPEAGGVAAVVEASEAEGFGEVAEAGEAEGSGVADEAEEAGVRGVLDSDVLMVEDAPPAGRCRQNGDGWDHEGNVPADGKLGCHGYGQRRMA